MGHSIQKRRDHGLCVFVRDGDHPGQLSEAVNNDQKIFVPVSCLRWGSEQVQIDVRKGVSGRNEAQQIGPAPVLNFTLST